MGENKPLRLTLFCFFNINVYNAQSRAGFDVGEFVDHSEDGRKFHAASIEAYNTALSSNKGSQGLSTEVVEARLLASVAMERNLRTGSLKVGMVVSRKSR
jgi:hypothetical protein